MLIVVTPFSSARHHTFCPDDTLRCCIRRSLNVSSRTTRHGIEVLSGTLVPLFSLFRLSESTVNRILRTPQDPHGAKRRRHLSIEFQYLSVSGVSQARHSKSCRRVRDVTDMTIRRHSNPFEVHIAEHIAVLLDCESYSSLRSRSLATLVIAAS
ncbi:hypothetical protein SCHPADRAFT_934006 [Schizopora paradoxa]|uniref:Uncharacterized protein n=1 Tax=Schizopora paradoxa TaxID=27342 RepID=A0A0H2RI27_9AGAM|nr:hypothetical protein SCHPADRAFT_934006 [Schizopora paradoxa]